ncbi:TonB-dependent receptor [Gluconacetobacter diazotrophicus]|uniref:TonB-dependent receptor n=1 Tax=Gluconacetobacter diazotrophicus TaxID=33996 RepID=A0A7W4FC74_GLUDI|nr:TonB-dependent receptor plug domain-containing protein [Gluconacetobacter diazotrophicus]MBB2155061.1 TonB-dependent receptor [Gluconacetobacter diazotrophicus]
MRQKMSWTLCAILASTALANIARADAPQDTQARKAASGTPQSGTPKSGTAKPGASKPGARKAAATPAPQEESVAVTARRNIPHNAENLVTRAMIEQQVAGTNILKSLTQVPGVSFSSTDALGLDTWGANVYMRGYFMDQLGMSLDGIPLNDQTYGNLNGVNIANTAISDDIERTNVSQGAGAVDIPSNTNLGGTMQFFTGDPKDKFGGKVSQGFGSYAMKHTYVRIDSGQLNPTGTKFFVSYARNYEEKYDSPSPAFMQQVDAKLVQPLGPNSRMSAFFNWSDAEVWGYADKSLDILNTLGWRTESFYPNYAGAYAAANWVNYCDGTTPSCATPPGVRGKAQLPAGWINTNEQAGVAFYDAGQHTVNYVGGLNFDVAVTDRLRWTSTIYGHSDTEYDTYGDPYQPSATGAPLSEQVWQPRQERYGFQTALEYHIADHTIHSGVWFENNNQAYSQFWYNEPLLGQGAPLKTVGPYTTYGPAFMQNYGFQWNTNTFQYHFMDTWRPLRTVAINYGFKSMLQTTSGGANYNNEAFNYGPLPNGSMTSSAAFLPHVNLDWRFLPHNEIYFDMAENMRPYSIAGTGGASGVASPWAVSVPTPTDGSTPAQTSQQVFQQLQKTLRPEKDFTYLLGYRYSSRLAVISLDGYRSDDYHRLISASVGDLNNPTSSVIDTQKAGMWGADATATITPYPGLSIYNSFSYNHFTYGAHVNVCPTEGNCDLYGKKMDAYPSFMYKTNVSYTWHRFTVHFDANYYSSRPFSVMNDTHVAPYWLANSGARYRFGDYSVFKNVTLDFNVYNLFNSKYIAMMGENGFPVTGDYQSMERGAVREFFGNVNTEF